MQPPKHYSYTKVSWRLLPNCVDRTCERFVHYVGLTFTKPSRADHIIHRYRDLLL